MNKKYNQILIHKARGQGMTNLQNHIELMATAYYQKTKIPPDEVELVYEITDRGMKCYFQRRNKEQS